MKDGVEALTEIQREGRVDVELYNARKYTHLATVISILYWVGSNML